MHELYTLEQTALEGYKSYNFPKGRSDFQFTQGITDHLMRAL
jgi:hypothetical protein